MDQSTVTTFRAKDGRAISVRPLRQEDAPLLISIFEHMGADSRYQRFHQPLDNPSSQRVQQEAEQMVAAVPTESFGFIALAGDTPVGAARYVLFGQDQAEIAVSIRDDYQNNGIGTHLVTLLVQAAREHGLHQLTAFVQASNKTARRLLEKVPFTYEWRLDGPIAEAVIDLTHGIH